MTRTFRVLVVDDSVLHRQTIADLLREIEGIEVIGRAADGQEALRMVSLLDPDLVTLDLEMPRMDGFTFLRLVMATKATPVLVISSFGNVENVFRALECGAVDFVPRAGGDLSAMRAAVREKVSALRNAHSHPRASVSSALTGSARVDATQPIRLATPVVGVRPSVEDEPKRLFVIAASTGGPPAIVDLVSRLPIGFPHCIVVAQHMPERFTKSFAERLARKGALRVVEGEDGARLSASSVVICPGNRSSEIAIEGAALRLRVTPLDAADRYSPSADRLFRSAAALGSRTVAVVVTGMGDDGAAGATTILEKGGEVWVESAETAVVDGMPAASRRIGPTLVLPVGALLSRIASFDPRS